MHCIYWEVTHSIYDDKFIVNLDKKVFFFKKNNN